MPVRDLTRLRRRLKVTETRDNFNVSNRSIKSQHVVGVTVGATDQMIKLASK
jgi:hypothetical protein